ncbi:hypothetical protein QMU85_002773 [Photobacterium damselae]|nr:hypothetical protein [Photobacterium damselae]
MGLATIVSFTFPCQAKVTLENLKTEPLDNYGADIAPSSQWATNNPIPNSSTENQLERRWYNHPFSNGATYRNNYGHEIVINASGGRRGGGNPGNRCQITIRVNGKYIADSRSNSDRGAKSCFVSANVPKDATYQISSDPYGAGGNYHTTVTIYK